MRNHALPRHCVLICLAFLFALWGGAAGLYAAKAQWDPIAPDDLAATVCKAYPGAHAEVLFDRLTLDTAGNSQVEMHYARYKLYTPKGVEGSGTHEIVFGSQEEVWNLQARVIRPDGTVSEYDRKNFNESVLARGEGQKFKRLAIAVPDLSPGDILEMRWSQTVKVEDNRLRWWYCQQTLPVREFTFNVEASTKDFSMQVFNVTDAKVESASRQSGKLICRNLPPFEEEPNMPPMRDVRGWFMMLYTDPYIQRFYSKKDEFWKEISSYYEEEFRLATKPNNTIKAKAAELTTGQETDEKKLAALYDFCRTEITNLDYFNNADLQALKKKLDEQENEQLPAKTLKVGAGRSRHINELFAALARAAGYQVQAGEAASRRYTLNVRHQNGYPFLVTGIILVEVAGNKLYYAPGEYFDSPGLVNYMNEAAPMLVYNAGKVVFEALPVARADLSPIRRKGRFTLDAEGNLEGEVEIQYSGHAAAKRKYLWHGEAAADIESEYRAEITKRLPSAEVTELKFENSSGIKLPLIARYRIRVPAYADLAGEKLLVAPGFFERSSPATFAAEDRKFAIFFPYAYAINDDIELILPEGFVLDAGSAPKNIGKPDSPLFVKYQIGYRPKARTLVYKREHMLGTDGSTLFQAASYPTLKKMFESISQSDEHTLVLKPAPVPAAPAPAATTTP